MPLFRPPACRSPRCGPGSVPTTSCPASSRSGSTCAIRRPRTTPGLKQAITGILAGHDLSFDCDWRLDAEPFLSPPGRLVGAVQAAVAAVQGTFPRRLTSGGTSDGRFIAPHGTEVVELGPINRTIHQIDEHVAVRDLDVLSAIYERVLGELLVDGDGRGLASTSLPLHK